MHFVKDKPMIAIHKSSGTNWEIIDTEMIEMTLPKDTRPISEIPITEFVKPQQHFWKPEEINLADDKVAEFARIHKEFIERQMEIADALDPQSVDRTSRAEAFRKMVMGDWFAGKDRPTYYITAKQKKPDRSELNEVILGPSRTGKSMYLNVVKKRD